jgi:ubiquinone/menaquinone biosynthesis C-methylase UbiE
MGYFLMNPLRRLGQDPARVVFPYVDTGDWVLDIGPGMGYFTLPLARRVGPGGKVVAADIQPRMLQSLRKRALRAGLADRIICCRSSAGRLGIDGVGQQFDFVLAFAVVHEIPDRRGLFEQLAAATKPGGRVLVADPLSRFSAEELEETVALAAGCGFSRIGAPAISKSRTTLLQRCLP